MRRFLQRLRAALVRPSAVFVYHASYARTVSGVPIDPARADEILAFLLDRGLIRRRDVSQPIPASLENLLRVHTAAYLETLPDPATLTGIFGSPVRPDEVQDIIDLQRLSVGGTIQATRLALGRGDPIAVNLKGGLHHAAPARGMGFCLFNDIAVAIRRLRARGFAEPVLVVDLDLHDGNGTRAVFATDTSVYTFSIHNRTWDETPAVAATSLALGEGVTDDAYLAALREALPPVLRAHRPGLVLYVAGCDPAADDQLGDWRITPLGMLERDRFVVKEVRGASRRRIPLVILPGGGYGPNAWRYSARFFGWLVSGRVVEPPHDMELALGRFRPVARQFAGAAVAEGEAPSATAEWSLSEADLAAAMQGGARDLVLGRYSRHTLELLLERLGFFKRLRDLGFRHPVLHVEFGHALGETVRVYGDAARTELLVELRMNRSRRVVPGMDVLYVEWLLLQNPHAAFSGRLVPLPGQEHPGLGMLGEVAAWLIVMCEALGLDGVVFVPAHYYTAALGRHRLRFLEPADQARFEALQQAVTGMTLADADRAIAEGRVVDDATGEPVRWHPAPMVVPVSGRLKGLVAGPSYAELVARARPVRPLRVRGGP